MNSPVICSLEQRRVTRQRTFTVTDIVTRLSVMPASVSKIYNSDIAEYLFLLLSFCRITVVYGFIHAFKIYSIPLDAMHGTGVAFFSNFGKRSTLSCKKNKMSHYLYMSNMSVHLVHGNWREWECKNPFLVVSNLRCSPCVPDHFHNFSTLFVFYFFSKFYENPPSG